MAGNNTIKGELSGAFAATNKQRKPLALGSFDGDQQFASQQQVIQGNLSLIQTNAAPDVVIDTRIHGGKSKKEKDEEWQNFIQRQMQFAEYQRQLEQLAEQYRSQAAWYHEQEVQAAQNMDKLAHIIDKSSTFLQEAKDIDDQKYRNGKFDREKQIHALKALGIEVKDNISDLDLATLFEKQKELERLALEEASRLYEIERKNKEEYDRLAKEEERKAREAEEKIKNAGSDTTLSQEIREQNLQEAIKETGKVAAHDAAQWEEDKIKRAQINSEITALSEKQMKIVSSDGLNDDDEPTIKNDSKMAKDFNAVNKPINNDEPISTEAPKIAEVRNIQKNQF